MKEILTLEDKRYLRMICKYLTSLRMKEGTVQITRDDSEGYTNVAWEYITRFDNNFKAEVPDGLKLILEKILNYLVENDLINDEHDYDVDWGAIDIDISVEDKSIQVVESISYVDSNEYETEVELNENQFNKLLNEDVKVPDNGILTIRYNGSGDDGYIDNAFDETGDAIPSNLENFVYAELSELHGGWENDTGSSGSFIVNFNNKTIINVHRDYFDESDTKTLWSEFF